MRGRDPPRRAESFWKAFWRNPCALQEERGTGKGQQRRGDLGMGWWFEDVNKGGSWNAYSELRK